MVLLDPSTTQAHGDRVQDLSPFLVLADVELRNELPSGSRARIPLNRYVERSFSIDITRDVRIQPFLLINRT
jgi:hypothetical protein